MAVMGSEARQSQRTVHYRPHVWLAVASGAMTPFFLLIAFGVLLIDPTVDIDCRRENSRTSCRTFTEGLLRPSIVSLSDDELRGARLQITPERHEHSYKRIELRQGPSVRPLADFSQSVSRRAVTEVNEFLAGGSARQLTARIVDPGRTTWQRFGQFPFQLIAVVCLAIGLYSLGRQTTVSLIGDELEFRRSRLPWASEVKRWRLQDVAGVEAVSRIPDGLAQVVGSLPWRNIYRANGLALRTRDGNEILLGDLNKRGRALHERMAAMIRSWLPPSA